MDIDFSMSIFFYEKRQQITLDLPPFIAFNNSYELS